MLDSLTSSIATILKAKNEGKYQKDVTFNLENTRLNVESIESLAAEIHSELFGIHNLMNKNYDEKNSEDRAFYDNCITGLVDIYEKMVEKSRKSSDEESDLSQLGPEAAGDMVATGNEEDKSVEALDQMNKSLDELVNLNQVQVDDSAELNKVLDKVGEVMDDKDEKKTKIAGEGEEGGKVDNKIPPLDPEKINMKDVAKSMAKAAANQLSPAKLIKAFFLELLPYIIIFGILIYGFVTGYLNGSVWEFILTLGGAILTAFLAYIAFQYVKALVLHAFKMLCEKIKLAFAIKASVFSMMASAMVAVVFIAIAVALVALIAAGIAFVVGAFFKWLFGKNNDEDEKEEEKTVSFAFLFTQLVVPKLEEIRDAIDRFTAAAALFGGGASSESGSLESIVSDGFTSVTNSLSDISQQLTSITDKDFGSKFNFNSNDIADKLQEMMNKDSYTELNNNQGMFAIFSSLSADVKSLVGLVQNIVDDNVEKQSDVIKQVTSSVLEENTRTMMSSYQVADGSDVLRNSTAYASSSSEETSGTNDVSEIIAQLNKIINHLSNIYSEEQKIANSNDISIWSALTD